MSSFLWHDYETFGIQPRNCAPAQFAAIRTDMDLNEIGAPQIVYCLPPQDKLPQPQSCLVTGITPQDCEVSGISEFAFAKHINAELSQAGTIGVGYNNISYDDELTRHLFWRNLFDPYAREWRNNNARWDMLDVMRFVHAVRPEVFSWPVNDKGAVSFKLQDLTAANGIEHENAHDALADVRATLELARRLKQAQPRLFDFCRALSDKGRVAQEIGIHPKTEPGSSLSASANSFLHVNVRYGSDHRNVALCAPIMVHPTNRNEILLWNLMNDPHILMDTPPEQIRSAFYARKRPEGDLAGLSSVRINACPMLVSSTQVMSEASRQAAGIDMAVCNRHLQALRAMHPLNLSAHLAQAFPPKEDDPGKKQSVDAAENLYGGFLSDADRRRLDIMLTLPESALASQGIARFDDERLQPLIASWLVREHASIASAEDKARWALRCHDRVMNGASGTPSLEKYQSQIEELRQKPEHGNERDQGILNALQAWGQIMKNRSEAALSQIPEQLLEKLRQEQAGDQPLQPQASPEGDESAKKKTVRRRKTAL